jgi:hypothetical protein
MQATTLRIHLAPSGTTPPDQFRFEGNQLQQGSLIFPPILFEFIFDSFHELLS